MEEVRHWWIEGGEALTDGVEEALADGGGEALADGGGEALADGGGGIGWMEEGKHCWMN